ncbi:MAG: hypothetical protein P4L51_05865, partial [Puia sp.]|nr:hypothetical protein [Puia sp.]
KTPKPQNPKTPKARPARIYTPQPIPVRHALIHRLISRIKTTMEKKANTSEMREKLAKMMKGTSVELKRPEFPGPDFIPLVVSLLQSSPSVQELRIQPISLPHTERSRRFLRLRLAIARRLRSQVPRLSRPQFLPPYIFRVVVHSGVDAEGYRRLAEMFSTHPSLHTLELSIS